MESNLDLICHFRTTPFLKRRTYRTAYLPIGIIIAERHIHRTVYLSNDIITQWRIYPTAYLSNGIFFQRRIYTENFFCFLSSPYNLVPQWS